MHKWRDWLWTRAETLLVRRKGKMCGYRCRGLTRVSAR